MTIDDDAPRGFRIRLNGMAPDDDRPNAELSFWRRDGDEPLSRACIEDDGSVEIDRKALDAAQVVRIGPSGADSERLREIGLNIRPRELTAAIERGTLDVARPFWLTWFPFFRCVTGRVRVCRRSQWWFDDLLEIAERPVSQSAALGRELRASAAVTNATQARLSPAASIDDLIAFPTICFPICEGTVEVWRRTCCCDPWIVFDPRLPELVEELEDLVNPFPDPIPDPIPDPFPGPRPGPRPTPRRFCRRAISATARSTKGRCARRRTCRRSEACRRSRWPNMSTRGPICSAGGAPVPSR
jgi:hypothetical protein